MVMQLQQVLIDTWWNVNDAYGAERVKLMGFNRYMVECECKIQPTNLGKISVLIDTWWNVNPKTFV